MIIRCTTPSSKKGRKRMRAKPRTLTGDMKRTTEIFGRAGLPGTAKLAMHYRPRVKQG